jgi:FkbM family methyltransferase
MFEGLKRLRGLGFGPSGILDVGAYEGSFTRTARVVFEDSYILMIEALTENEAALADVCREVGNADYKIAVLGDTEKEATSFFVANTQIRPDLIKTGSSKFKENSSFPIEERRLQQHSLGHMLAGRGLSFQLLKLDVQGAELEIIRGLGSYLSNIEVILMEMSLVNYNAGAPLMDVVLTELRGLGFVLYDIVEEHRVRGRLYQIDGIFVRPDSRFRPQPPFWA